MPIERQFTESIETTASGISCVRFFPYRTIFTRNLPSHAVSTRWPAAQVGICQPDTFNGNGAAVYGWLTEGFDTVEPQDARALLDRLA